jgi:hypothetical protein
MRRALLGLSVLFVAHVARGDDSLALSEPAAIHLGDHPILTVRLRLPDGSIPLLLVTLSGEGEALEVVRGRFLRSDARDPEATLLLFDVPTVAARPGRSLLRVRVDGVRCTDTCEPFALELQRALLVTAN